MIDHEEDKEIKLSVSAAKEIIENLSDTGFENDLKELLQEQLDKHKREIRHIRAIEYCDHEWHTFTKEDIYKFGSPKTWKIEDRGSEYIEEFYMLKFGYCEKCKMRYEFNIFTDEDFDRLIDEYESEGFIALHAYNALPDDVFKRLYEKKRLTIRNQAENTDL